MEIGCHAPAEAPPEKGSREDAPPAPPPAAARNTTAVAIETLAAHALVFFAVRCLPRLLLPFGLHATRLAGPLALALLFPPSLLPTALLAAYCAPHHLPHLHLNTIPPLHDWPTLFPHPLDTRLLSLLLSNPLWLLGALAFLTRVYFPLRWWAFRGLYIYGTGAVSDEPSMDARTHACAPTLARPPRIHTHIMHTRDSSSIINQSGGDWDLRFLALLRQAPRVGGHAARTKGA